VALIGYVPPEPFELPPKGGTTPLSIVPVPVEVLVEVPPLEVMAVTIIPEPQPQVNATNMEIMVIPAAKANLRIIYSFSIYLSEYNIQARYMPLSVKSQLNAQLI
jgi:hypothetical protein